MRVLIAEPVQPPAREHARHPQTDGHTPDVSLSARAAGLRPVELPDALMLRRAGCQMKTTFTEDAQTRRSR